MDYTDAGPATIGRPGGQVGKPLHPIIAAIEGGEGCYDEGAACIATLYVRQLEALAEGSAVAELRAEFGVV
jgi:hypothetical protein